MCYNRLTVTIQHPSQTGHGLRTASRIWQAVKIEKFSSFTPLSGCRNTILEGMTAVGGKVQGDVPIHSAEKAPNRVADFVLSFQPGERFSPKQRSMVLGVSHG